MELSLSELHLRWNEFMPRIRAGELRAVISPSTEIGNVSGAEGDQYRVEVGGLPIWYSGNTIVQIQVQG